MIDVPTAAWAHTAFDLAAWGAGLALSVVLYRWRLKGLTEQVAGKVGGGYFAALASAGLPDGPYGSPADLRWAVTLGDGVGRHPVQVYESLAMGLFLAAYLEGLARRRPWAMRRGFYALCIWYGLTRFGWEFLKPYPPLIGPLNLFHLLCGGLVAYGWVYYRASLARERAQGGALSV